MCGISSAAACGMSRRRRTGAGWRSWAGSADVQGEGAGRLDRLGAGAAVPASAAGGEQHAVPDPAGCAGAEPRRCRRGVCRRTWRRRWYPALLADVRGSSRFEWTCCRASNRIELGETRATRSRMASGWPTGGRAVFAGRCRPVCWRRCVGRTSRLRCRCRRRRRGCASRTSCGRCRSADTGAACGIRWRRAGRRRTARVPGHVHQRLVGGEPTERQSSSTQAVLDVVVDDEV